MPRKKCSQSSVPLSLGELAARLISTLGVKKRVDPTGFIQPLWVFDHAPLRGTVARVRNPFLKPCHTTEVEQLYLELCECASS